MAQRFIPVGNDMCCVEQSRFGKGRERAATAISLQNGFAKRCLVEALLNRLQCIAPLSHRVPSRQRLATSRRRQPKSDPRLLLFAAPFSNEDRKYRLISARSNAKEIDNGGAAFARLAQPPVIRCLRIITHEGIVD